MRDLNPCPVPTTRLDLPGTTAAQFIRAFVIRDTRHCKLSGERLLNRFPASSHCVITWFLEGTVELLSCGGQAQGWKMPACVVSGCQTHPITSRNCGGAHGYMAIFYPDAFHALFGLDLGTLQNRFVDAAEVMPPEGLALVASVAQAGSDRERNEIIERFVLARAPSIKTSPWARVRRMGSRISLAMASAIVGIGPRQLQRLAVRQAGANLQTLARLARGEHSFLTGQRQHYAGKPLDWADHAVASDYADQSHMARECKAQTGRTPAQLVRDVQTKEADWIYRLEMPLNEDR